MQKNISLLAAAVITASASTAWGAAIPSEAQHLIDTKYAAPAPLHAAAQVYAQSSVDSWTAAKLTGQLDKALSVRAGEAKACLAARIQRLAVDPNPDWEEEFHAALTSTPEMFDRANVANEVATGEGSAVVADQDEATACKAAGV
jgi:hypothetical protein